MEIFKTQRELYEYLVKGGSCHSTAYWASSWKPYKEPVKFERIIYLDSYPTSLSHPWMLIPGVQWENSKTAIYNKAFKMTLEEVIE